MLRFFRSFRHRLLAENRVSRYLLYAFGEIVLVVIGILIALEVNAWNTEAGNRKKERYYLNSVKTSIELSQDELKRVINDAKSISSSADTLFHLLTYQKLDRLEGSVLDSLLFEASDYSLISLNDGGVREILNSGSLDIIRNNQIRVSLASWEERLHKIRKFENETELLSLDYLRYLDAFINVSRWQLDSASAVIPEKRNSMLSDPRLRNYLFRIGQVHVNMYRRYTEEKAFQDTLQNLINKELLK